VIDDGDDVHGGCAICRATPEDPERARYTRSTLIKRGLVAAAATSAVAGLPSRALASSADRPTTAGNVPKHGRPIMIEASWVLGHDGNALTLLRDHTVVVRGDRIEAIVAGRKPGNDHRIDAHGQILLPGFISGHTHVAGATPTRGIIEAGRSFARPLEIVELLSDDELDDLTAFNLAELLLSGCTTHVEMALSLRQAVSYARVAARYAARGYPGGMIPGIHRLFPIWFRSSQQALLDSEAGTLQEVADNLAFGLRWNHAEEDRIRPQMSPHAADTQTPATLAAISAGAKQLGNGIHIHLLQRAAENTNASFFSPGKRAIQWLADHDFFAGPFFGAHMSAADLTVDPALLKAAGGTYSHCPSAGGAGGGTQAWPEILAAGVNTNIGIDTHSNDFLENLKLAVLYGQARFSLLRTTSPVPIKNPTIWDAVRAATVHSADELERPDLGRIAVGAKADLTAVDVTGFLVGTGAVPPEPMNNLLYTGGLGVRMTMTDGIVQVLDGKLVIDDAARVLARGGAAVQKLWDILTAESWFTPTPT
jgi:cytosine/adenosine deaminase-related metal-dependent hydrolase